MSALALHPLHGGAAHLRRQFYEQKNAARCFRAATSSLTTHRYMIWLQDQDERDGTRTAPVALRTVADTQQHRATAVASSAAASESEPAPAQLESRAHGRFEIPKRLLRGVLPLSARKAIARVLGLQPWLKGRAWWVRELLRDFAEKDPNAYHRFLWSNHFCYAESYEVAYRFGADQIHATRRLLFDDLQTCLSRLGTTAASIDSVFEIGSSLGYNLRFLETGMFAGARTLEGCDIDAYAVARGNEYLQQHSSKVRVHVADMTSLDALLGGKRYDVTLCAGVLMYLREDEAQHVVASVLKHTGVVAAFAGLADPDRDNSTLSMSGVRIRDRTFIHDIDGMVARAGGRVLQRRWEGPRTVDGNTVYFVFATGGRA